MVKHDSDLIYHNFLGEDGEYISVITTQDKLQSVVCFFWIQPSDTIERNQARIATFTSSIMGIETTQEHLDAIMDALQNVHIDMTESVFLELDDNMFIIDHNIVTIIIGWWNTE